MPSSDHSAAIRKAVRFMVQERIYTNTSLAKMIARFLAHVEVETK